MSQLSLDYSSVSEEDSIEELHLSNRSINALSGARVRTIGEVRQLVESRQLTSIRGLGKKINSRNKREFGSGENP